MMMMMMMMIIHDMMKKSFGFLLLVLWVYVPVNNFSDHILGICF